jgi:hypothetical protein
MTMPKSDLASLMAFIGEHYTFTPESYPDIDMTPEGKIAFAVRHSTLHMMKSTGKIAAEAESADHGGQMNHPALRTATAKMLVNVLKLAEELGMTPDELAFEVTQVMTSK